MASKETPPNNTALSNAANQVVAFGYDFANDTFRMVRVNDDGCLFVVEEETQQATGTPTTSGQEIHAGSGRIRGISNATTSIVTILDGTTEILVMPSSTTIQNINLAFATSLVARSVGIVTAGAITILYI